MSILFDSKNHYSIETKQAVAQVCPPLVNVVKLFRRMYKNLDFPLTQVDQYESYKQLKVVFLVYKKQWFSKLSPKVTKYRF